MSLSKSPAPDCRSLDARFGRAPGVTFAERLGGPVAILEAAGSTAIVALHGGQVLSWRAPGFSDDVLWLSPSADLGTGKAVRGGIPVCWPWFGPHPIDANKPAHGIVRTARWTVAGSATAALRARLVLSFDTASIDPALWHSRARAELEITLGETLTVSLSTDNLSAVPFAFSQALHTYLNVGDIADVTVTGLENRSYIDQLDGGSRKKQVGAIIIGTEVDRIYQASADDVVVSDKRLSRQIRVSKSGSQSTVIWNPWIEKAARLGDMGADGHRHMLCVETANAGDDAVMLGPRARHRIVTELKISAQ